MTKNAIISYKKLIIWQKADAFTKEAYRLTQNFPKFELYALTSQFRRASLSVVLNIIEGYARNNQKEFKNFLRIAYASLLEAEYLIDFAFSQKYLPKKDYQKIIKSKEECGKTLWSFIHSQKF